VHAITSSFWIRFRTEVLGGSNLLCVSHQPQYGSLASRQSEQLLYVEQLCTRTRYTCNDKFPDYCNAVHYSLYAPVSHTSHGEAITSNICGAFARSVGIQQQHLIDICYSASIKIALRLRNEDYWCLVITLPRFGAICQSYYLFHQ